MNDDVLRGGNLPRLCAAIDALGMSVNDVWLAYFAVGGNVSLAVLASWLDGRSVPAHRDYDVLAVAVNEALMDSGLEPDIPYAFNAREN
jgi:hypothetical protein